MVYLIWIGVPMVGAFILWPWLIIWFMCHLLAGLILIVACGRCFAGWFPEHESLPVDASLEEIEERVEKGR